MGPQQMREEVNAFGGIGNVPGTCTQLFHLVSTAIHCVWFQTREQRPERQCVLPRGPQLEAELSSETRSD